LSTTEARRCHKRTVRFPGPVGPRALGLTYPPGALKIFRSGKTTGPALPSRAHADSYAKEKGRAGGAFAR
jgi:hypothetical protein